MELGGAEIERILASWPVERLATLAMMLADRRHNATRIEKILGGNLLRVFGETWKA